MLGMWGMLLLSGQVKETNTEPFRIAAYLFSEGITAISLILGGLLSFVVTVVFLICNLAKGNCRNDP